MCLYARQYLIERDRRGKPAPIYVRQYIGIYGMWYLEKSLSFVLMVFRFGFRYLLLQKERSQLDRSASHYDFLHYKILGDCIFGSNFWDVT